MKNVEFYMKSFVAMLIIVLLTELVYFLLKKRGIIKEDKGFTFLKRTFSILFVYEMFLSLLWFFMFCLDKIFKRLNPHEIYLKSILGFVFSPITFTIILILVIAQYLLSTSKEDCLSRIKNILERLYTAALVYAVSTLVIINFYIFIRDLY